MSSETAEASGVTKVTSVVKKHVDCVLLVLPVEAALDRADGSPRAALQREAHNSAKAAKEGCGQEEAQEPTETVGEHRSRRNRGTTQRTQGA